MHSDPGEPQRQSPRLRLGEPMHRTLCKDRTRTMESRSVVTRVSEWCKGVTTIKVTTGVCFYVCTLILTFARKMNQQRGLLKQSSQGGWLHEHDNVFRSHHRRESMAGRYEHTDKSLKHCKQSENRSTHNRGRECTRLSTEKKADSLNSLGVSEQPSRKTAY